jgi:hypothetical protein
MLTFLMHIRTTWNDYFTGSPTSTLTNEYGTRQAPSGTGVNVSNCLFRSISSGSSGGALSCTSVTYLLVESSTFHSCQTSSGSGGAIYFSNSGGECVLHKVCGYDCYLTSSSNGQFAYIYVNNVASIKNYVNYSSITRCVTANSNSYETLRLYYGKIFCPSVNVSLNKCYYRSGIYCYPTIDSNSVTCSLSYSSFTDNIATQSNCIQLWMGGANYEIKSCNVLRNTQGSLGSRGTFYTQGNVMIENSCILENVATYIFHASSYTITLSNCTVDLTSSNGNVIIQNTVTKSFILALNHISTGNCHSEYDSAGYLTPIIQSPSPSKKQIHCYTGCQFFYQSRIRDFVSLLFIFLIHFIHLNDSY